MKIAYITGSLAAGKTGLGDYSLLLENACRKKGMTCATLGLHDPEVSGDEDKVDSLQELLKRFGVMEVMRTGTIAMSRGVLTDFSDESSDDSSPRL